MEPNYFFLLPVEIQVMIFDNMDLKTQLDFRQTCTSASKFDISNFWDANSLCQPQKLTEGILRRFPKIKYLNLYDNKMVQNLNFLSRLSVLNIGGFCTMTSEGIADLRNLRRLYASNNYHLLRLDYKPKLEYVDASGNCGIPPSDLMKLPLVGIDTRLNEKLVNFKL